MPVELELLRGVTHDFIDTVRAIPEAGRAQPFDNAVVGYWRAMALPCTQTMANLDGKGPAFEEAGVGHQEMARRLAPA